MKILCDLLRADGTIPSHLVVNGQCETCI